MRFMFTQVWSAAGLVCCNSKPSNTLRALLGYKPWSLVYSYVHLIS